MANANGWGDGASNNDIGWGKGADNAIGWGSVYSVSSAGLTDIVGVTASSLLLDTYTNAAVAYSLRKLRTAYSGSAIRVRRSVDNAEQDIAFVGNDLDTASLLTFCGAGNGFVTTWYDQSGNANNLTNTTAANQPQIVSSGNILIINGKPNINANAKWLSASALSGSQGFIFSVSKNNLGQFIISQSESTVNSNWLMFDDFGSGDPLRNIRAINQTPTNVIYGNTNINNTQKLMTHSSNGSSYAFWSNGISQSLTTPVGANDGLWFNARNYPLFVGRLNRLSAINGNSDIQEIIIYNSNQSSNRTGIESNINTFYTIY